MTTLADLALDPGILRRLAGLEQLSPGIPGIASPDPIEEEGRARCCHSVLVEQQHAIRSEEPLR